MYARRRIKDRGTIGLTASFRCFTIPFFSRKKSWRGRRLGKETEEPGRKRDEKNRGERKGRLKRQVTASEVEKVYDGSRCVSVRKRAMHCAYGISRGTFSIFFLLPLFLTLLQILWFKLWFQPRLLFMTNRRCFCAEEKEKNLWTSVEVSTVMGAT